MPRRARLDVPGTLHHVMIRGIDGAVLFSDEEELSRAEDAEGTEESIA
jgi:hypothetical protein